MFRRYQCFTVVLFVIIVLPVCRAQHQVQAQSETHQIVPGDTLAIAVWREPELSTIVTVRSDGKITLPLLNDMRAVGLTSTRLQEQLEEDLKPFVAQPRVTVTLKGNGPTSPVPERNDQHWVPRIPSKPQHPSWLLPDPWATS